MNVIIKTYSFLFVMIYFVDGLPNSLVLHVDTPGTGGTPDTADTGGPHSLVTWVTVSNLPTVDTHDDVVGGQLTDHSELGRNASQLA